MVTEKEKAISQSKLLINAHDKVLKAVEGHGKVLGHLSNKLELHELHHKQVRGYRNPVSHQNASILANEIVFAAKKMKESALRQVKLANDLEQLAVSTRDAHKEIR